MLYIAYPSKSSEQVKQVFLELAETFEITTPEDRHQVLRSYFVEKSKELLKKSNVFIGEVSQQSFGLEIEAKWAHKYKVPIVLFVKEGRDYPSSLKDFYLRLIKYEDIEDLRKKLNDFLNNEFPGESKQEYFKYGDKKQYKSYKKGWERKYK